MRTVFIVNPAAGGGRGLRAWNRLERDAVRLCAPAEVIFTTGPGTASALARDAAGRAARLVAVGGDGTFNEVLNGIMADERNDRRTATLSLLSVGTGRDLARTLGLPPDPHAQLSRIVDGTDRAFDVGRVAFRDAGQSCTRYFANVASFGLSGAVDRLMARRPRAWLPARQSFQLAVIQAVLTCRNAPVRIAVDDGPWLEATVKVVAVCNGQYFGAGMRIAPQADVADGRLMCVAIGDMGVTRFMRKLHTVYRGAHLRLPEVSSWSAERVVAEPVTADAEILLDIDGDAAGTLPATFDVRRGAVLLRY